MLRLVMLSKIRILLVVLFFAFGLLICISNPVHAADYDIDLHNAMTGGMSGLDVQVRGSGGGWYGDSMRVYFNNNTGSTIKVRVPIGLRLAPDNISVQTMVTAGNEIFTIPPGQSDFVFKAFCGEKHDSAPGSSNVFRPDGFVDSDLLKVLQRINKSNTFNSDAQDAVWNKTDNLDISSNERAQELSGGSGPSSEEAAGAAAILTALILAWALSNGTGPAFMEFVKGLLRIFTGDGGTDTNSEVLEETGEEKPPEEKSEDTKTPEDDQKKDDKKSEKQTNKTRSPAWSLANRPSPDHEWDPKTGKWVHRDELKKQKMKEEGYVFDGKNWVKPEIKVEPLNHIALRLETESSAKNRMSEKWAESEAKRDDFASGYIAPVAKVVSAVDEYNYQKKRMDVLLELQKGVIGEMNKIRDAMDEAERAGNTDIAEYLKEQLDLARENLKWVNAAKDNCSKRMQKAADRIMMRGIGASMKLGHRGASDAIGLSRTTLTAGRMTNNLLDQARRGSLPGQRGVFKTGESPPAGDAAKGLPKLKLNRGDKLFSSPSFQTKPVPVEGLSSMKLNPGDPLLRKGLQDQVLNENTLLRENLASKWKGETYKGMRVIRDDGLKKLGENNRLAPDYMRINPNEIRNTAAKYGGNPQAFEELTKGHEYYHSKANLRYSPLVENPTAPKADVKVIVKIAPRESINIDKLKLQTIANKIRVEEGVQQHLRMDFQAGKIPNVTNQDFAAWEKFNTTRLDDLRLQRDLLKSQLKLKP